MGCNHTEGFSHCTECCEEDHAKVFANVADKDKALADLHVKYERYVDWSRTQMDAQLVATTALEAELARAREALTALVQWDQRHPKSFVIGEGGLRNCVAELDAIVKKAKSALTPGGNDDGK